MYTWHNTQSPQALSREQPFIQVLAVDAHHIIALQVELFSRNYVAFRITAIHGQPDHIT